MYLCNYKEDSYSLNPKSRKGTPIMETNKIKVENPKVFVEIEYNDGTSFSFDVILHSERESALNAEIMMITRGTLMASSAQRATAYNYEGFPICSYRKD